MKTFKDLEFKEHFMANKGQLEAKQAVIKFDNGRILSVIFGTCFYSNGVDTYEAMELNTDSEPRGYLTEQEITNYMLEIQGR